MLSGLVEVVLQPVLEMALQLAGYLTGYVVVPALTIGRVLVEPDSKGRVVFPAAGGVKRREDGTYLMDAELGSLCGLVFWGLVAAGVYFWRTHG